MTTFIILCILYFLTAHIGFYKFFEKLDVPGWKALIPFYGTYLAIKLIRKPKWWVIIYYIPFVGFVVWIGIIVEFLKMFGYFKFYEHVLGVVFAGIYLPYLGYKDDVKFIGHDKVDAYKKSKTREWVDAIAFAVIAASLIRAFYLEAFTIPTSSMEKSLLIGDYLFVSKMSYGPRFPNTPLAVPFTHHSFPGSDKKSYREWINFDYHRLPGFGDVERYDNVVFNFPAGDTVILEKQAAIYYHQVAQYGRDHIWRNFTVTSRPVDKRENYIKRCVGLPGDEIKIENSKLFVNGESAFQPEGLQYNYKIKTKYGFSREELIEDDLSTEFFYHQEESKMSEYSFYSMALTDRNYHKIKQMSHVSKVEKNILEKGTMSQNGYYPIFPNHPDYKWTRDNFGPLTIPSKGSTVELTFDNLPLYQRIIDVYEENDLEVKGNKIFINGKEAKKYTFKMDYYWMMGDNRHNSQDSRFWGFVPEDHVVGKAVFIWFSLDPNKNGFNKVRWKRLFSIVDKD